MERAIIRDNPIYCKNCDKNSLQYFDKSNRNINYNFMINNDPINIIELKLNKVTLKKIKCNNCNKEYFIDWTHGVPYPLYNEQILDKFKTEESKDEIGNR